MAAYFNHPLHAQNALRPVSLTDNNNLYFLDNLWGLFLRFGSEIIKKAYIN